MPIETQTDISAVADHLISYPHSFVKATGNVSSAIFLSQLLSLSKNATETDGWMSKSMTEWEELTGLRRHEQETARKNLRAINLLKEEVRGMPATLCFRLKHDEIARLLPEANQYAETGKLVSNLVCSSEGEDREAPESAANQFAENSKPLENKACETESHLQDEVKKTNSSVFEERVRAAFNRLEGKIDWIKKQTALLNEQGVEKNRQLVQMKLMLIGLLVMVFLILMLCISIWWSQPNYQYHATSLKPAPMNIVPQNRK